MNAICRIVRRLRAQRLDALAESVAAMHALPLRLVLSRDRTARVSAARDELWAAIYLLPGWTYLKVGAAFERDWTSVRVGVDRHLNRQRRAA